MMLPLTAVVFAMLIQLALGYAGEGDHDYDDDDDDRLRQLKKSLLTMIDNDLQRRSSDSRRDIRRCPDGFHELTYEGYCAKILTQKMTWDRAALACRSLDAKAHLAAIDDVFEQHDLESIISKDTAISDSCRFESQKWNSFWIGAQRIIASKKSPFVWRALKADGTEDFTRSMTYTNWARGEPNYSVSGESCVAAVNAEPKRGYKWNDIPCDLELCALCETEMV